MPVRCAGTDASQPDGAGGVLLSFGHGADHVAKTTRPCPKIRLRIGDQGYAGMERRFSLSYPRATRTIGHGRVET